MAQSLDRLKESPSQTAGPYVHIGLTPNFVGIGGVYGQDLGSTMVNDRTRGERVSLVVTVFDGVGAPLRDVLVEIWQADAEGFYASPAETRGRADPDFTLAREYMGEAYLTLGDVEAAKGQLAEIEKRCGTGCAAYAELVRQIAEAS